MNLHNQKVAAIADCYYECRWRWNMSQAEAEEHCRKASQGSCDSAQIAAGIEAGEKLCAKLAPTAN
jgi:hypothetical protein